MSHVSKIIKPVTCRSGMTCTGLKRLEVGIELKRGGAFNFARTEQKLESGRLTSITQRKNLPSDLEIGVYLAWKYRHHD